MGCGQSTSEVESVHSGAPTHVPPSVHRLHNLQPSKEETTRERREQQSVEDEQRSRQGADEPPDASFSSYHRGGTDCRLRAADALDEFPPRPNRTEFLPFSRQTTATAAGPSANQTHRDQRDQDSSGPAGRAYYAGRASVQELTTTARIGRNEGRSDESCFSTDQRNSTANVHSRVPPPYSLLTVKNADPHPHHERNSSSSSMSTSQVQPTFHPSSSPSGSRSRSSPRSRHASHHSRQRSVSDLGVDVMQGAVRYHAPAAKTRKSPEAPSTEPSAGTIDQQRDIQPYLRRAISPAIDSAEETEQLPIGFTHRFHSVRAVPGALPLEPPQNVAAPRFTADDVSAERNESLNACLAAPVLMTFEEYNAAYPHFDGHNPDYMIYRDRWEAATIERKMKQQMQSSRTSRSLLTTPTNFRQSPSVGYRTVSPAMMEINPDASPIASALASSPSLHLPAPVFHEELPATFVHRESVLAFLVNSSRPESLRATPLRDFLSVTPDSASSPKQTISSLKASQPKRSPLSMNRPLPQDSGSIPPSPAATLRTTRFSDYAGRETELESLAENTATPTEQEWAPKQFSRGRFVPSTTLLPASEDQPFVPILPFDVSPDASSSTSAVQPSLANEMTRSEGAFVTPIVQSDPASAIFPQQPLAGRPMNRVHARTRTIDLTIQSDLTAATASVTASASASSSSKSLRASSSSPSHHLSHEAGPLFRSVSDQPLDCQPGERAGVMRAKTTPLASSEASSLPGTPADRSPRRLSKEPATRTPGITTPLRQETDPSGSTHVTSPLSLARDSVSRKLAIPASARLKAVKLGMLRSIDGSVINPTGGGNSSLPPSHSPGHLRRQLTRSTAATPLDHDSSSSNSGSSTPQSARGGGTFSFTTGGSSRWEPRSVGSRRRRLDTSSVNAPEGETNLR